MTKSGNRNQDEAEKWKNRIKAKMTRDKRQGRRWNEKYHFPPSFFLVLVLEMVLDFHSFEVQMSLERFNVIIMISWTLFFICLAAASFSPPSFNTGRNPPNKNGRRHDNIEKKMQKIPKIVTILTRWALFLHPFSTRNMRFSTIFVTRMVIMCGFWNFRRSFIQLFAMIDSENNSATDLIGRDSRRFSL